MVVREEGACDGYDNLHFTGLERSVKERHFFGYICQNNEYEIRELKLVRHRMVLRYVSFVNKIRLEFPPKIIWSWGALASTLLRSYIRGQTDYSHL